LLSLSERVRAAALRAYGQVSDTTRDRARDWAVLFALMLIEAGRVDDARLMAIGRRALAALDDE
jgi:hypothetical protein